MPFNIARTKELILLKGLSPACQSFVDAWFAACSGSNIPRVEEFSPESLPQFKSFIFNVALVSRGSAIMTYIGSELNRIAHANLQVGQDWLKLTATAVMEERIQRAERVAFGHILRNTREVLLESKVPYFFDTITVPLGPDENGSVHLSTYFDWAPPNPQDTMIDLHEIVRLATSADFFPLVPNDQSGPLPTISNEVLRVEERAKIISRNSIRLLLNMMGDLMRATSREDLDPLDILIALAVGSANVSHIDTDPELTRKYAAQVEPDSERKGISRAAVSRATQIPLETVRRRVNSLIERGLLTERSDGVILSASNRLKLGVRHDFIHSQAQLVLRMVRDLQARGVNLK